MEPNEIMMLGLGLTPPWRLVSQRLDTSVMPYCLSLEVAAERGTKYPCPCCGELCGAHDYKEKRWRHLNFFQHHCYITAQVPRVNCPRHGIKRVHVPWAREHSGFTLLFEQVVISLAREMPVNAAARIVEVADKRLWRIIKHYVDKAKKQLDLSHVKAIGLDETACKRGHNYVTIFIDMEKKTHPVVFVTPGKGKETVGQFCQFLHTHNGDADHIKEVVCDMSKAFMSGVKTYLPHAQITVDWFHVVQQFVRAVDETRKQEHRKTPFLKDARFAFLKGLSKSLTPQQVTALVDALERNSDTARAWKIKEALGWIRAAESIEQVAVRIDEFFKKGMALIENTRFTGAVKDALMMLKNHASQIMARWASNYTNARLEGYNGLFQAARSRARGYRNTETFITMIYMIASPVAVLLKST